MEAVAGVFPNAATARYAAYELRRRGLDRHTVVLPPGTREDTVLEQVPVDDTEAPGMGSAVGSVVGGVVGLTTVSLLFPGVGTVAVMGMMASAVAGATAGLTLGEHLERKLSAGLTRDEVDVYGNALRSGRAVVVAGGETHREIDAIREIFRAGGAESVDPAREDWLLGIHDPRPKA
jgi:hypothetical protein